MAINYKKLATKISQEYLNYPGLIGILWIGSTAFGIQDKEADIDIRLLVNHSNKKFPMKQFTENNIQIEIDEMDWQWLTENLAVDSDQRWIREKSVILYDPQKQITEKFQQLAALMETETKTQLWQYFKDAFYSNEIEKCLKRHDQETTNLYFYKAVDSILKFIFLYHNQPVPPLKWRWHFLTKNNLLPEEATLNLKSILLNSKSTETKLKLLISVEKQLQQLMIE
ncbi:MAG: hypothetical protein U0946_06480, partial [Patescibacteria group bacterium]|nr:hypothetical protein [Patescibacteria group bacterium]